MNEATWKLINGEQTNVPVRLGHWGWLSARPSPGLSTLAWRSQPGLPDLSKDHTTNPMQQKAKTAALAMAKGECGDYYVTHPIEHLRARSATARRMINDPRLSDKAARYLRVFRGETRHRA